jgi:hypothetical protein
MKEDGRVGSRNPAEPLRVALIICLIGAIVLLGHRYLPLTLASQQLAMPIPYLAAKNDSDHYIALATGRISDVPSPFSKRVLYPWMAGEIARTFHVSLAMAFVGLNYVGFILAGYGVAALLQWLKMNPWWTVLFFLVPMPLESLQRAYFPDLFHVTLVSIFFLLVAHDLEKIALAVLMAAFLCRDNTIILCLVVCWLGCSLRNRILLWGGMLVLFAGLICESWFVRLGQPNRHHLPEFLYMAALVPSNFMGNVLGLLFWTDAGTQGLPPLAHWHIPRAFQFGADHDVYVGYNGFLSFHTFIYLLSLFGCAPLIIGYLLKDATPIKRWALPVKLAFYYGVIAYFLGTSLGRTFAFRMIAYAWPIFWIAMPYLFLQAKLKIYFWEKVFLIAASLLTAWIPNLEGLDGLHESMGYWAISIVALYIGTAVCLNRIRRRSKSIVAQDAEQKALEWQAELARKKRAY